MFIYVIIRIKDTGKKLTISLTVAFVHIFQEKKIMHTLSALKILYVEVMKMIK